jgi:hypothetical protein
MSWLGEDRDTSVTHISNSSEIKAEWARLIFEGKLDEKTTYNVDVNIAANTALAPSSDNTSGLIDEIYMTRTLADGLTLDIGKKPILFGGAEASHLLKDQYATSAYYNVASGKDNEFALTLNKKFLGQTLSLEYFNGNKTRTSGANNTASQSKFGYAAQWVGSIAGEMIQPNIGYVVIPKLDSGKQDIFFDAGLTFNVGSFSLEADYGTITYKKQGTNSGNTSTESIVGNLSYTGHDLFTPFTKVIADTDKTNADGSKKSSSVTCALGFEFREAKASTIRYHAVYSTTSYKPVLATATDAKHTYTTILVGAKFETSIL